MHMLFVFVMPTCLERHTWLAGVDQPPHDKLHMQAVYGTSLQRHEGCCTDSLMNTKISGRYRITCYTMFTLSMDDC